MQFITKDKDKIIVWCTTNQIITFREFMQYVLDNSNAPQEFMIIDASKNVAYNMYKIAIEMYGMHKRTFEERINNIKTGKWSKYSDDQLRDL